MTQEDLFRYCRGHGHFYDNAHDCTEQEHQGCRCEVRICEICSTERHDRKYKGVTIRTTYRFPQGFVHHERREQ